MSSKSAGSRPWERRKQESGKAYVAFLAYRDLGPDRSLDKAYASQTGQELNGRRASRHWSQWAKDFDWVRRAEHWDVHNTQIAERAFSERIRELGKQQAEFTVQEFDRLVRRVRRADKVLDRADEAPVSETEEETLDAGGKVTGRKRTKALNFAGYAALMKEARESARQAILGSRDGEQADAQAASEPVRKIVWAEPTGQEA